MKKTIFALSALLLVNCAPAFAAPLNDLTTGQTALGVDSDTFYLEHKLADNFTLGYQDVDRGRYGSSDDIYGQLQMTNELRGIIGHRDFGSGSMYLGLGLNGPLSPNATGYASFVASNNFKELQAGANFNIARNVDLNVNYHAFMPDRGSNENGVGVGATLKF
ncbi:hypothetical protein [Sporomusa termitida]|uniref:YfaZ n=1 Tax=Sporomusa termitida TaxID=2377 RepID=A0A517DY52_9FIRM|nr:hypothetical protein [Sporomusa termitida]QDR82268.1 hypothetical protein SPTER_36930 [Sporomusa termitida]